MNIITRDLVERLMLATGWRRDADALRVLGPSGHEIVFKNGDPIADGVSFISYMAGYEDRQEAIARLGMLAAAEHEREQMNAIRDRDMMTITSKERIRIDERMRSYQDLLTLAGVDPEAWEKAMET